MRGELCGDDAAYLVNGVLGFCEDCFATIDDEWLEDCEDDED